MRSFKLFLIACIFLLVGVKSSFACTCAPPQSASQELKRATAVFSGKVVAIKRHKQSSDLFARVEVVFEVKKVWKGVDEAKVSVFTSSQSSACGYSFREGRTYLVYAEGDAQQRLMTSICSRTRRLKDAREDLEELDRGNTGIVEEMPKRMRTWRLARAPHDSFNARFVDKVHSLNLKVHACTVNEPQEMERMRALGVDGIITDYPQTLLQLLGRISG